MILSPESTSIIFSPSSLSKLAASSSADCFFSLAPSPLNLPARRKKGRCQRRVWLS